MKIFKIFFVAGLGLLVFIFGLFTIEKIRGINKNKDQKKIPNILFCLADDWGPFPAGILGDTVIKTPSFDRIAKEGALFVNAYVNSPTCTASRAGILTGQMPHRLRNAINLSSDWLDIPPLYTDLLSENGFHVGFTGKGWAPGKHSGREINPAGKQFENFDHFLSERKNDQPFCFWFGSGNPHRPYDTELKKQYFIDPSKVSVPPFLPDVEEVRSDLADYYAEVKSFDNEVGILLQKLDSIGELENTIIVMTGDNGFPFPRAKGNLYMPGINVPLAIRWAKKCKPNRVITDFISFTDFAPTFLELAGINIPECVTGKSFLNLLMSDKTGRIDSSRDRVFAERERHTWCQPGGESYPVRAICKEGYLYIRNFRPYLFPAGDPYLRRENSTPFGHVDCDEGPSKYFIIKNKDKSDYEKYYKLCFDRRSAEELYNVKEDPYQLNNLTEQAVNNKILNELRETLSQWMDETCDPRSKGETDIWDSICWHGQVRAEVKIIHY